MDSEASERFSNNGSEKQLKTSPLLNAAEISFKRNNHVSPSIVFDVNRNEENILVGTEAGIIRNNGINLEKSVQREPPAAVAIHSLSLDF